MMLIIPIRDETLSMCAVGCAVMLKDSLLSIANKNEAPDK